MSDGCKNAGNIGSNPSGHCILDRHILSPRKTLQKENIMGEWMVWLGVGVAILLVLLAALITLIVLLFCLFIVFAYIAECWIDRYKQRSG